MRKGLLYALASLGVFFLFLLIMAFVLSFLALRSGRLPGREGIGVVEIQGLITEARSKVEILEKFLYNFPSIQFKVGWKAL